MKCASRWQRAACGLATVGAAWCVATLASAATLQPGGDAGVVFEARYFGMHMHKADTMRWPSAKFGSWRLWNTYLTWDKLEPERGRYDFTRLDKMLDLAELHGVDVLLPIGMTPRWASARPDEPSPYGPGRSAPPADLADWRRFVTQLVEHTRGRVSAYEVWNEANIPVLYTGDVPTLVEMTRMVHEAVAQKAPGAKVVAPSGAGLLDARRLFVAKFLAAGGGPWSDILSFHLYTGPNPPEVMVEAAGELRATASAATPLGLPLWNTESGYMVLPGPGMTGTTQAYALPVERAAAYVVRSHLIARALGYERYYAYAWDNKELPYVLDDLETLNEVGLAYSAMTELLIGTTLRTCSIQRRGPCHCELVSPTAGRFVLAWAAGSADARWSPGGMVRVQSLAGKLLQTSTATAVLSEMPVVVLPAAAQP